MLPEVQDGLICLMDWLAVVFYVYCSFYRWNKLQLQLNSIIMFFNYRQQATALFMSASYQQHGYRITIKKGLYTVCIWFHLLSRSKVANVRPLSVVTTRLASGISSSQVGITTVFLPFSAEVVWMQHEHRYESEKDQSTTDLCPEF